MLRSLSVLLVLLVACSEPATQGSFVEQANAQCRQINDRFRTVPAPSPGAPSQAEYLDRALTVSQAGATGLRSVQVPVEHRSTYDQLLAAIDEANAGLRDAAKAARRNDVDAIEAAGTRISRAQQRFRDLSRELGLLDCVTAGSDGG